MKATSEMAFGQMGDLGFIDTSGCVNLEMQPGEFVLFNERTLHHSDFLSFAKRSDKWVGAGTSICVTTLLKILQILKIL